MKRLSWRSWRWLRRAGGLRRLRLGRRACAGQTLRGGDRFDAPSLGPTPNPQPIAPVGSVQAQPLPPGPARLRRSDAAAVGSRAGHADGRGARRRPRRPDRGVSDGGRPAGRLERADRRARFRAERSWRGVHGVFGFVAPGAETGGGCRAYSQTIYVAGRPNRGQGVALQAAGRDLEDDEARLLARPRPRFAITQRREFRGRAKGRSRGC